MKIYIPNDHVDGWPRQWIKQVTERLHQYELAGHGGIHSLAKQPEDADAILFSTYGIEPLDSNFYQTIREHELVNKFIQKCFLWCEKDLPLPLLPGIYASLPNFLLDPNIHQAFCYQKTLNKYLEEQVLITTKPDVIFSFVGSISSPIRAKILNQSWEKSGGLVLSQKSLWGGIDFGDHQAELKSYAEFLRKSLFVLCPRGNGQSSYRIFEAMQVGRVPVIIADHWVAPAGIDWSACSVQIPEKQVHQIPDILESYRPMASQMGDQARKVWLQWFSPERQLNSLGEVLSRIQYNTYSPHDIRQIMQRSIRRYRLEMRLTSSKVILGRLRGKAKAIFP